MTFLDITEGRPQHNVLPAALVVEPRPNEVPLLLQYWRIALRWKWVMATIVALALVAGLVMTLLVTPEYTATSRIEISRSVDNVTKVEGLTRDDPGPDQEFYQTQYALLKARSLAERVARSLNLGDDVEFFSIHGVDPDGSTFFSDEANSRLTGQQREQRVQRATEILLANVSINPIRGSSLVDISYASPNPVVAARIANAWSVQFMEANLARRFASTADARKFLEERLTQLRSRLEQSERDLVGYASNKGIITLGSTESPDGKTSTTRTLVEENLQALSAALTEASAARIAAEARASAEGERGVSGAALANPAINSLRERRAQAAADYARLLVQFEPEYPTVRALSSQIASLEQAIAREEARVQTGTSSEYRQAVQREQALLARVNALKQSFVDQRGDSIQYNIYQREVDTNRQLYDGLLQRYKEIGVAGVGTNTVAAVDEAQVPDRPSSPNLILNMLLAFIAGLIAAIVTALVLDQIDEGVKDPAEVSSSLGIPLLGSIPNVDEKSSVEDELADQKSSIFEAYLSVQTNLAFSSSHGVPRSMVVTSTRAGEGKSTTSIALARILGRTGRRVVLIDADMRSPSLATRLGLANEHGLSNYLAGDDNLEGLVPTSHPGVSALTAGPQPPNAAELLSGTRLKLLIERLLQDFDNVILDAPPVLGLADAPLLAASVESTVYVVEANGVRARGIRTAIDRVRRSNAHVTGVVLTKLDDRNAYHGYGYGYGYGYGKPDTA